MKTWRDVEEASLHDPALQALVTLDQRRAASREQLLIATVLTLSQQNRRLIDQLVEAKCWQSNQ